MDAQRLAQLNAAYNGNGPPQNPVEKLLSSSTGVVLASDENSEEIATRCATRISEQLGPILVNLPQNPS